MCVVLKSSKAMRMRYAFTAYIATEFIPQLNSIKQAIDCLDDIAKHGESVAAEYREEPLNAKCKKRFLSI